MAYIYYSAIKKDGTLAICDKMDRPRGYYVKWNKSDRERQILHDFHCSIPLWNMA